MLSSITIAIFDKLFTNGYKFIDHYLIASFLAFVKGFEVSIVLMIAVIFLLIAVSITIRQVRKLPKSYMLQIIDLDGREAAVDGLRQIFSTYDAAESYARLYRKAYANQYTFKVTGIREKTSLLKKRPIMNR